MTFLPKKTTWTIAAFLAIAAIPEFVPALKNYRIVSWDKVPTVLDFPLRNAPASPQAETERLRPEQALAHSSVYPLDDSTANLEGFYAALHRTERKEPGAVTRILHYGDSPTTADLITADMRDALQTRFGDAGHGFALVGKPWAWYGHRGIEISSSGWHISPANQSDLKDGLYGLGGVSFQGSAGAVSHIRLSRPHRSVEVAYLRQPGGGTFTVSADDQLLASISTAGTDTGSAFVRVPLPDEAEDIEVRVTSGPVRLFGVDLEKPGPGVVYSSLGLNGAYTSVLSRMFRESHWAEQLQHYRPDLVIINYGTNESVYDAYVDHAYTKELREAIRRLRAAAPNASILIMSPMDRGARDGTGQIATVPALLRLINLQRQSADELGCAFFNTFQAMGGAGTMGRWYSAEPRLVSADFIHPTPGGARMVGDLLYRAVMNGYYRYKLRKMQQRLASASNPKAAATN